jgi:hypothetical protein
MKPSSSGGRVQQSSRIEPSNGGLVGMGTDPTGVLASAHAESFVQVDSFMTHPPSESFISQGLMSADDIMRQSQTCPIQSIGGPTGLLNSSHINNSGRGLVRSTSAGSVGASITLQPPRPTPRRKLARWNSLDACLAEELEISSERLASRGTLQYSRPIMASLQEEGNVNDISNAHAQLQESQPPALP